MKTFSGNISSLKENEIFVFGSNTQGRHGKGAALTAKRKFGAIYGNPKGLQGQSYAIITKDISNGDNLRSIPLSFISEQIEEFIQFAECNPELKFYVTRFGSSLAGYTVEDIANLFLKFNIPDNIVLPEDYARIISYKLLKELL